MAVLKAIMRFLKGLALACFVVMLFAASSQKELQVKPAQEYQVKAVFLFNFTQFIQWPQTAFPESNTPMVIGILGKDPFGKYLDETVRNEKIDNHPLVIQRFQSVNDISTCHILFINITEKDELKTIFDALKSKNILTVGDANNFSKYGGMIRFFTEENKTRIRINMTAVKSTDLTISSKLLRLADVVENQTN